MNISDLTKYLPARHTEALFFAGTQDMQEIRMIAGRSLCIIKNGSLIDTGVPVTYAELGSCVNLMCRGSMYAAQETLSKGYITVQGGHRVGVCGQAVCENGAVKQLKDITALCIRVSREVKGAANGIINYLDCGGKLYNTLIISPPGCGKTTVLRDIARILGNKYKVCIADERSEIAAFCKDRYLNDVGKYTCVLDCVPKAQGIQILLRTMSPDVIITDESGSAEEELAIKQCINCGVKIITTAHGYSEKDVSKREHIGELIKTGVFERIVVLSGRNGPATIEKIISDGRVMSRA